MYNRIDIQLHTMCNRKCDFCIFSEIDIPNKFMSDNTFNNTLLYIKNNIDKFSKPLYFVLHKYFEPLLYPDILYKRSKKIKEMFPDSFIKINSNCDNLNNDTKYCLKYIDKMSVGNYANIKNILKLCKINNVNKKEMLIFSNIGNTEIIIHQHDFIKYLTRGGILYKNKNEKYKFKDISNKNTCPMYPNYFSVAYDGSIMPCYDSVPYYEGHKKLILGNINSENLKIKCLNNISDIEECQYCNCDLNICGAKNGE